MDLAECAERIFARRSEAVLPVNRAVSLPGWRPQPNQCHDNVLAWVSATPKHKHVFGYLLFDYRELGFWTLRPHSLVEFEDGTLVDITPRPTAQQHPFIRHLGSEEEFAEMAMAIEVRVPSGVAV
jgi:hypothetical protein